MTQKKYMEFYNLPDEQKKDFLISTATVDEENLKKIKSKNAIIYNDNKIAIISNKTIINIIANHFFFLDFKQYEINKREVIEFNRAPKQVLDAVKAYLKKPSI